MEPCPRNGAVAAVAVAAPVAEASGTTVAPSKVHIETTTVSNRRLDTESPHGLESAVQPTDHAVRGGIRVR
jgi:hypothetical protein